MTTDEQPEKLHPLTLRDTWASKEPVLDFVLPGLLRGTVGLLVAAGSTGKSFVMLATALGIGTGRDVAEIWGEKPKQGSVWFLSLEDVREELERRLHVIGRLLTPADREAASDVVKIYPASGQGLVMAKPVSKGLPRAEPWFFNFANQLRIEKPRLLIIDTFNRFLGGLSENDGGQMAFVLHNLERLAAETSCAIVLCHHASKAALTTGTSHEAHAARGSSVITDNARWQCNLSIPSAKGDFKNKTSDERKRFAWLEFAKLNYGPPREPRLLIRGEGGSIQLAKPGEHTSAALSARQPRRPGTSKLETLFKFPDVADA